MFGTYMCHREAVCLLAVLHLPPLHLTRVADTKNRYGRFRSPFRCLWTDFYDSQCIEKLLIRAFQRIAFRKNPFTNNETARENVFADFLHRTVLEALIRLRGGCHGVHEYRLHWNTRLHFTMAHIRVKSWTTGRPQVVSKSCMIGSLNKSCKVGLTSYSLLMTQWRKCAKSCFYLYWEALLATFL